MVSTGGSSDICGDMLLYCVIIPFLGLFLGVISILFLALGIYAFYRRYKKHESNPLSCFDDLMTKIFPKDEEQIQRNRWIALKTTSTRIANNKGVISFRRETIHLTEAYDASGQFEEQHAMTEPSTSTPGMDVWVEQQRDRELSHIPDAEEFRHRKEFLHSRGSGAQETGQSTAPLSDQRDYYNRRTRNRETAKSIFAAAASTDLHRVQPEHLGPVPLQPWALSTYLGTDGDEESGL